MKKKVRIIGLTAGFSVSFVVLISAAMAQTAPPTLPQLPTGQHRLTPQLAPRGGFSSGNLTAPMIPPQLEQRLKSAGYSQKQVTDWWKKAGLVVWGAAVSLWDGADSELEKRVKKLEEEVARLNGVIEGLARSRQ